MRVSREQRKSWLLVTGLCVKVLLVLHYTHGVSWLWVFSPIWLESLMLAKKSIENKVKRRLLRNAK